MKSLGFFSFKAQHVVSSRLAKAHIALLIVAVIGLVAGGAFGYAAGSDRSVAGLITSCVGVLAMFIDIFVFGSLQFRYCKEHEEVR